VKTKHKVHFSTGSDEWETPDSLFNLLHSVYHFDIDVAASAENAKLPEFWTKQSDVLGKPWIDFKGWCNPPYSRGLQAKFIAHAREQVYEWERTKIMLLLPARPDTQVWHDEIFPHADWILFLRGRLKFKGGTSAAPFPSALVSFGFEYDERLNDLGAVLTTHPQAAKGASDERSDDRTRAP
jgi:site-specific DNA-methyltransferase (adenine-specific)